MKKNITILYVEDDDYIRKDYMFMLSARYLKVFEANNGQEGLSLYKEHSLDIVITDIEMPLMNGLTMVEHIRKIDKKVPILILTAHVDNNYLLQAVNWNNIYFVSKESTQSNTSFENALKKIEKYLEGDMGGNIYEFSKNIFFDFLKETLMMNHHLIPLTPNEKKLLALLCEKSPKTVTYETIYEVVWGRSKDDKLDSIRSLVRSVNRKLQKKYILNTHNEGYRVIKI